MGSPYLEKFLSPCIGKGLEYLEMQSCHDVNFNARNLTELIEFKLMFSDLELLSWTHLINMKKIEKFTLMQNSNQKSKNIIHAELNEKEVCGNKESVQELFKKIRIHLYPKSYHCLLSKSQKMFQKCLHNPEAISVYYIKKCFQHLSCPLEFGLAYSLFKTYQSFFIEGNSENPPSQIVQLQKTIKESLENLRGRIYSKLQLDFLNASIDLVNEDLKLEREDMISCENCLFLEEAHPNAPKEDELYFQKLSLVDIDEKKASFYRKKTKEYEAIKKLHTLCTFFMHFKNSDWIFKIPIIDFSSEDRVRRFCNALDKSLETRSCNEDDIIKMKIRKKLDLIAMEDIKEKIKISS